jgi:hypothetical protein
MIEHYLPNNDEKRSGSISQKAAPQRYSPAQKRMQVHFLSSTQLKNNIVNICIFK